MTTASGFTNGILSVKGKSLFRVGSVAVGDVGAGSGAVAVTGYFTSASKTSVGTGSANSTITIVYPDLEFVPVILMSVLSLGTVGLDNDILTPIVGSITSTGCIVYLEETSQVTQNIDIKMILVNEFI